MGYRKYAADYEIEYVERLGQRRAKAVRIYVGPYYRLTHEGAELKKLKRFYIIAAVLSAVFITLPMCIDCVSTRTMYVQLPSVAALLPLAFAASSVLQLCTAGEKLEREQNDALHDRLSPAALAMTVLTEIAAIGALVCMIRNGFTTADLLVMLCNVSAGLASFMMFAKRSALKTVEVENPEKPRAKKK